MFAIRIDENEYYTGSTASNLVWSPEFADAVQYGNREVAVTEAEWLSKFQPRNHIMHVVSVSTGRVFAEFEKRE